MEASDRKSGMNQSGRRAYVGTSGFSYAEWKGSFYPEKLAGKEMLAFYATKLPTVEINNTFYRLPKKNVLEGWASQTPSDFRFTIKASRRITHFKKLRDPAELLSFLLGSLAALGARRGPVLFQLPPTLKADVPLLEDFLATLAGIEKEQPTELPSLLPALEFRHPSWFDDAVLQALESGGATLVAGDLDDSKKEPPLVRTAPFTYLRLRKTEYTPDDLHAWAERIAELDVQEVYAYFKHEELGPRLAADLLGHLGAP